jgi:hypothetical protein
VACLAVATGPEELLAMVLCYIDLWRDAAASDAADQVGCRHEGKAPQRAHVGCIVQELEPVLLDAEAAASL